MSLPIYFTESAERDIYDIYDYIAVQDSPKKAEYVLDQLQKSINTLKDKAERGICPKELSGLGMHEYRQIYFKPYRIIYRCFDNQIVIYVVVDGRRNMQTLLQRRLLSR